MTHRLILVHLVLALSVNGCCAGASGDDLGFIGSAPTAVAGTGADAAGVTSALSDLMDQRVYDTGMYMQWSCSKSNKSKLLNGVAETYFEASDFEIGPRVTGMGQGADVYYTMQFALPEGQLTVRFVYNHAQHLIYDVRVRAAPKISETSIPADCTFTGTLAGQAVDVTFQQEIRGIRLETFRGGLSGHW